VANINNKREWFVQLIDTRKKKPVNDDSGQFQVYTAGSAARATIYNASGVALTQHLGAGGTGFVSRTMTDGQLSFYTNISVSTVDISVLTVSGRAYFLKALKPSNHRVDVDPEQSHFNLVVPLDDGASSTALRSTGFSLRKGMIIEDAFIRVTAAGAMSTAAAKTMNAGVAGDSDAFLVAIPFSTTGYKRPVLAAATGLVLATVQYGTQLAQFNTGADAATAAGWICRRKYFVPTATVLSFARAAAATLTVGTTADNRAKMYLFLTYQLDPTVVAVTTD